MVQPNQFVDYVSLLCETVADSPHLWRWGKAGKVKPYRRGDGLNALKQTKDDELWFSRKDGYAQIQVYDIRVSGLNDLDFGEPTVIKTENQATTSVTLDNLNGTVPLEHDWSQGFDYSKSEEDSLLRGFEQSMSVTAGYEGAGASVSATISSTFKEEMTKQTGTASGGDKSSGWPLTAPEYRKVEGFLTWDEQTLERHVTGRTTFDFGFRLGKRHHGHWDHSLSWPSLGSLISTIEGKGSVKMPARDYFIDKPISGKRLDVLKALPFGDYDQTSEYKGANAINIKVNTWKRDANGNLVAVTQPKKKR